MVAVDAFLDDPATAPPTPRPCAGCDQLPVAALTPEIYEQSMTRWDDWRTLILQTTAKSGLTGRLRLAAAPPRRRWPADLRFDFGKRPVERRHRRKAARLLSRLPDTPLILPLPGREAEGAPLLQQARGSGDAVPSGLRPAILRTAGCRPLVPSSAMPQPRFRWYVVDSFLFGVWAVWCACGGAHIG